MIAPRTSQFQIDSVRPQENLHERLRVIVRGNRAVELSSPMAAQATSNDIMITKPGTGPRSALSHALARKTRNYGILPPRLEAARMHEKSPALASPKTRT